MHAAKANHGQPLAPVRYPVVYDGDVLSPDHRYVAHVKHVLVPNSASVGYLEIRPANGSRTRTLYSSNDSCCHGIVWVSPRLIAFDDDYNAKRVDLATGRVRHIAAFSDFAVSRDGRWVAGWASSGGHVAETVGVVSINGTHCRIVPRPDNADDTQPGFMAGSKSVYVLRRSYNSKFEEIFGTGRIVTISMSMLRRELPSDHGLC
jgi:hypothetical protein